jgi:hypothetical protein
MQGVSKELTVCKIIPETLMVQKKKCIWLAKQLIEDNFSRIYNTIGKDFLNESQRNMKEGVNWNGLAHNTV